ncbi:hypothetical protein D3C81_1531680 [compost metagenome]
MKPKDDIDALIASGVCRPETQASTVPAISNSRPVGIRAKMGFLPNQLMKISNSTTKETVGASNACSIGFIASNSRPRPDRQESSTVRGII